MTSAGSMRHRIRVGGQLARTWRPTGRQLRALLRSIITSYIALGIALYVLPGEQATGPIPVLTLAILVAGIGVLLRPLLLTLAVLLGSFGLLLVGILSQAIILGVAIAISPDIQLASTAQVILVSWSAAIVAALVNWLFDAGSEDSFLAQLLGRAVRVARRQRGLAELGGPGSLIIQLDGVGETVLRQAITAGAMPTLSTWLRSGTHTLRGWHTGLPATTPAGQAVLLYGDTTQIPSFRWYEKESARLMVANHPRDAAELDQRLNHSGALLTDGGVSISNLFSGGAATNLLTMSDARLPPRTTRGFASFATTAGGLLHSLVVFVGVIITEIYQGRRQRRRRVEPRVRRGWLFALLRAVTTALLRDLNVALVTEQIARGAPVIYVDFLDYDEVAHHAGPSRPESMRILDGLDRLLRFFADVVTATGHEYTLVVVSDHGQAQGATFDQLTGGPLHALVDSLCDAPEAATDHADAAGADSAPAERWGPANLLLTGVARSTNVAARAVTRSTSDFGSKGAGAPVAEPPPAESTTAGAKESRAARRAGKQVTLGEGKSGKSAAPEPETGPPTGVVVAASGSLAHLYLADHPGVATAEEISRRHPRLIDGLAQCPQIGVVLLRSTSAEGDLLAVGAEGWRRVQSDATTSGGEGDDPLEVFGASAAADVIALFAREHVGDLVLLGRFDPSTAEVVAFEELVGSHGGLGGGQTDAVFIHPSDWDVPAAAPLSGRQVHDVLVARLPRSGDDAANTFARRSEAATR
ncbi:Type I phosphodiesterase / nucleotide pyrophosphatase [Frankineae bacterium MT45]|nr:Type I phosphodiesterase / nucleotide pyrophosphatase [Frankineae bacterium MT45]